MQVFSNLVSNAIKYTPQGEVGIRARRAQSGVEVVVHDSGIGLSREEQAQLFTQVLPGSQSRGNRGRRNRAWGWSSPRPLSRGIRARSRVESVSGEGTHFRVVLPIQSTA